MKYTIDWESADATALALMLTSTVAVPAHTADPLSLRPAAHHKPDDIVGRFEIPDLDGGLALYMLERAKWEESINYFMYHHGWLAGLNGKALQAALANYDRLSIIIAGIFYDVELDELQRSAEGGE